MQNYRKLRYATCVMGTDDIRCLVRLSVQFGIVYDLACSRQLFRALEDAPHREQSGDWYSDWKKVREGRSTVLASSGREDRIRTMGFTRLNLTTPKFKESETIYAS